MSEYRKKLIEVALPLEAINKESAREKTISHGHPSTLHLWWARRPLATCRAVLFAQMVDDPSSLPDEFPTEEAQEVERQRLFRIIEEFVKWQNITNEAVLHKARVEIARSAARNHGVSLPHSMTPAEVADALKRYAPPVQDPFAGGGSIPLEAQRLGLEAHASDLNPVSVLINKALIEIPPKFAERPPMNPEMRETLLQREWKGAQGLAEDVRHYGMWMRNEAFKSIGYLYPKVQLPKEYGGGEATVIAWLWARTVKCPNPACGVQMPLLRSFALSTKKSNRAWAVPHIDRTITPPRISFAVSTNSNNIGSTANSAGTVSRQGAHCLACGKPVAFGYLQTEGQKGSMGAQLLAVVAEGRGKRYYLSPRQEDENIAGIAPPDDTPEMLLSTHPQYMAPPRYGMTRHCDLFTSRQLVALTTFSNLVSKARARALHDSDGDEAYANAIATYLGMNVSKLANRCSTICFWDTGGEKIQQAFARQAVSMTWDFAEGNPFSTSTGNFIGQLEYMTAVLESCPSRPQGYAQQHDARDIQISGARPLISTDPPYYDNVPYADLSDYFYVWLRRSLCEVYPLLFTTLLVPKQEELVADSQRLGSRANAQRFFEEGLGQAFASMRRNLSMSYLLTIYYAFRQSESAESSNTGQHSTRSSIVSTGWETMLEGVLSGGFSILGTWPVRTEQSSGLREVGRNALASSIVLVCRPRPENASFIDRRGFLIALKRELPRALKNLQRGNIAPVDLAQASIGPGMAVFSRYSKVLESDGTPMRVRTALQLINQMLDEVLAEQEGEYDADTRWAVAWFEQFGMDEGPYGVAETLSKAKNTALGALVESGILQAHSGKVRLLRRDEFSGDWNPATAKRLTVWEATQRLIRALQEQGDAGAAVILDRVGSYGEVARDLAYRLYTVCEHKKWADEALAYNSLVVEWSDIGGAVEQLKRTTAEQAPLFS